MTTIYFVRHSEPDYSNHDDRLRPLTQTGKENCRFVTEYLKDKQISVMLSSPYKRSYDTIKPFAEYSQLPIAVIDAFRERAIDTGWIQNYNEFIERQWNDFNYKLSGGESLQEVQDRNISAIKAVLKDYKDKNIVIGTHGTALSTIIHFYDKNFGFEQFDELRWKMPFIVKMYFEEENCVEIEMVDLV